MFLGAYLKHLARQLTVPPYHSLPAVQSLRFSQRRALKSSRSSVSTPVWGMRPALYRPVAFYFPRDRSELFKVPKGLSFPAFPLKVFG